MTLIGGLSGLAFAPFFLFPFAYIGLYTLAILTRRSRNAPAAFLVGWAFGLGQFVVGLSWITESFAVEAEKFSMLAWPSVIALSAFLAVFPALAAMAARYLGGPSLRTFIILPATWAVAEMPLERVERNRGACAGQRLAPGSPGSLLTAREITGHFRKVCPRDPVRYDFCLTRLGIRRAPEMDALLERWRGEEWDGGD